jgi:hypothetical protein
MVSRARCLASASDKHARVPVAHLPALFAGRLDGQVKAGAKVVRDFLPPVGRLHLLNGRGGQFHIN